MSETQEPPKDAPAAAPPPAPPGLGELFERSLSSLVLGGSGYAALAERPAPSYGSMTALAAAFAAAGLGLNVALAAVSQPELLGRYPAWFYAAVSAGALGACLAVLLLSSALLFGLGRALGGREGFVRAYQAAAMLFALAPAQALTGILPYAWLAPSTLFVWAGTGALVGLLRAGFPGALAACALLGGLSIAGQAVARAAYAKSLEAAAQAQVALQAARSAAAFSAALQGAPGLAGANALGEAIPPAQSSLDLLRGPAGGDGRGAPAPLAADVMLRQGDALRGSAVDMLDSVLPMLSNPALARNLDAQGKADMQELQDIMTQLKAQTAARSMNARDHAQLMQRLQAISMRLMMPRMKTAPAAPAPAERRR